jgi:hypothetical protein
VPPTAARLFAEHDTSNGKNARLNLHGDRDPAGSLKEPAVAGGVAEIAVRAVRPDRPETIVVLTVSSSYVEAATVPFGNVGSRDSARSKLARLAVGTGMNVLLMRKQQALARRQAA